MNMKKTLTNENDEIFAPLQPLEVQDNNNRLLLYGPNHRNWI
jgi:hypothetical protein